MRLIAITQEHRLLSVDPNHPCVLHKGACSHSCRSFRLCVFVSTHRWVLNKFVLSMKQKDIPILTLTEEVYSKTETEAPGEASLAARVCSRGSVQGEHRAFRREQEGDMHAGQVHALSHVCCFMCQSV